jgi:hypothetical protein
MTKRKRTAASVYSPFSAALEEICLLSTTEDGGIHPGSMALNLEKNTKAPWSEND